MIDNPENYSSKAATLKNIFESNATEYKTLLDKLNDLSTGGIHIDADVSDHISKRGGL